MKSFPKEAIVLAGGLGTRLASVVSEVPKPMAPVAGRPFLEYTLIQCKLAGIERVVLSVGHKWEVIERHFGRSWNGLELAYAVEAEPLGTGGGIKLAFGFTAEEDVWVLNGDTLFAMDLGAHWEWHRTRPAQNRISLALAEMQEFDRYGTVALAQDGTVTAFREKAYMERGTINAGLYLVNRMIWEDIELPVRFSFEKDVMERWVGNGWFSGRVHEGYFIDIGIPEDYARAQIEFPQLDWVKAAFPHD